MQNVGLPMTQLKYFTAPLYKQINMFDVVLPSPTPAQQVQKLIRIGDTSAVYNALPK